MMSRTFLVAVVSFMTLALCLSAIVHLSLGSSPLSLADVWQSLWAGPNDQTLGHTVIIWEVRLPRLFAALIVGASLAASGAALQGLFQNPLADPYILGVTSGGACGAAIALWLGSAVVFGPTAGAFMGSLLAAGLVLSVARAHAGVDLYSILLAGIAVGLMFSAVLSYVLFMAGPKVGDIIEWLLGNLGEVEITGIRWMSGFFLLGMLPIFWYARALDAILLGEDAADALVVPVSRVKIAILVSTSLLVTAAVAYCGLIGFVGLVVPHLVRMVLGPGHRILLPVAALGGALLLVLADIAARTLHPEVEIPVGVMTAAVGGPFFLVLIARGPRNA